MFSVKLFSLAHPLNDTYFLIASSTLTYLLYTIRMKDKIYKLNIVITT